MLNNAYCSLLRPGTGAEYCDQPVCLCVCLSASIFLQPLDRSAPNFVCTSPLAVARSSSGGVALRHVLPVFMDDVTFGRNGRDGERWRLHRAVTVMNEVAIPGRSLMSVNADCLACIDVLCVVSVVHCNIHSLLCHVMQN